MANVRELDGQVALVTGGGTGIGRAIAHALADAGAQVAVSDLDLSAAERAAAELPEAIALQLDVTSAQSAKQAVAETESRLGPLDILANNAGVSTMNRIESLTEAEWVLREPGSGTRSVFEQAVSRLGIKPGRLRITMELPSNEAVRAAVEAGLGATAISASVAAPSIEAGLLHHVKFHLPQREFHLLRRRQRHQSRLADALLATLEVPTTSRLRSRGNQRRT